MAFLFSFVGFKIGDTTLRKLKRGQTRKRGHFTEGFASSELPYEKKKNNNNPLATQAGQVFMKIKYQVKVKLKEKKKVKHACSNGMKMVIILSKNLCH